MFASLDADWILLIGLGRQIKMRMQRTDLQTVASRNLNELTWEMFASPVAQNPAGFAPREDGIAGCCPIKLQWKTFALCTCSHKSSDASGGDICCSSDRSPCLPKPMIVDHQNSMTHVFLLRATSEVKGRWIPWL